MALKLCAAAAELVSMQAEDRPANRAPAPDAIDPDRQICCSMTSVLLSVVRDAGGDGAVAEVLARAGSGREPRFLENADNWVSLAEATALLDAGVEITGDEAFPRRVGEQTVRRHAGTQVSTVLRSLGSTEAVLEQITLTAAKLSAVTTLEALEAGPGRAVVLARAREGFTRSRRHCDWAKGLLSSASTLFGLPVARVTESECQARGDERCLYEVSWDAELAAQAADPQLRVTALEAQLLAMSQRVKSCYATAGDLVSSSDLTTVLERVVQRAANAVRAPAHILAVRARDSDELEIYSHGVDVQRAKELALATLEGGSFDGSALIVEVASSRRAYGQLIAHYPSTMEFFPQEEELLGMYAKHAAAVLDMATALEEAARRHGEISLLHALSQALSQAGTSEEVAERLTLAVPKVVDCDRVGVWRWDREGGCLRWLASSSHDEESVSYLSELAISADDTPHLQRMIADHEPVYFAQDEPDPYIARMMELLSVVALVIVPIVAHGDFLGVLTVSVTERPERLLFEGELLTQLTSVAALAATAVQNGLLVDALARRARHDGLTGLLNRVGFRHEIDRALLSRHQPRLGLLFVDLDDFKLVNDEYGHEAGDELIREVARRLRAAARAGDIVARFGGDEFAIVLMDVEERAQLSSAEARVRSAFAERLRLGELELSLSASVGAAMSPDDGSTIRELIKHADAAMYVDKARRRKAAVELHA
jgi:diguanylate cyclase (GGDEF)-like protein